LTCFWLEGRKRKKKYRKRGKKRNRREGNGKKKSIEEKRKEGTEEEKRREAREKDRGEEGSVCLWMGWSVLYLGDQSIACHGVHETRLGKEGHEHNQW
jgi:hypothetical protein